MVRAGVSLGLLGGKRRLPRALVYGAGLGLFACLVACSRREPETPKAAVDAYAAALRDGRADEAYALLSDEAKREVSFAVFEEMLRQSPDEARELAKDLSQVSTATRVTATVTAPNGETLLLVLEDGQWRVDASAIELYGQRSPREALASFVRALERRRYDILLRFVPDDKLEGLTAAELKKAWEGSQREEIQALSEALRLALPSAKPEVTGDRATFAFGAGGAVALMRERGVWKVEDIIR